MRGVSPRGMEHALIWQPVYLYQEGNDFGIVLDHAFAREMLDTELPRDAYRRIQELPGELMGFRDPEPYTFHANTCLLREVNLSAGDGKWLSIEHAAGGAVPALDRPLRYATHNLDYRPSASDVTTLLGLFDIWVSYAELLKDA